MKKERISARHNEKQLSLVLPVMSAYNAFPMFGTLLGIIREGGPIENDDDIDFYCYKTHRADLTKSIIELGYELNLTKRFNGQIMFETYVHTEFQFILDIYYYWTLGKDLLEPANFGGTDGKMTSYLKIDQSLIFPLQKIESKFGLILIPKNANELIELLYTENWKSPKVKGVDYIIRVFHSRPIYFSGLFWLVRYKIYRKLFLR